MNNHALENYVLFRGKRHPISVLDPSQHVIFPGTFNPIHYGHVGMAQLLQDRLRRTPVFAINASNPDKGTVSYGQISHRVAKIRSTIDAPVLITKGLGLFVEKACALPNFSFLIGSDTMERILDSKYYDVQKTLQAFIHFNTRFLVVERVLAGGGVATYSLVNMPKVYHKLFSLVGRGTWRVSSTELREGVSRHDIKYGYI